MKKIEAVVMKEKFADVDKSLSQIGIGGLTVVDGKGRGRAKYTETVNVRGRWTFEHEYAHRSIISLVVEDGDVDKVIKAIMDSASTGSVGDGKIFVIPIEKAIDIASGEEDDDAALDLRGAKPSGKK